MQTRISALATLALVLGAVLTPSAAASAVVVPLAEPTDCWIENQTPSVQLGAQARYVVHLSGGSGSYSISFAYGDGWADNSSVTGTQATFAHWFSTRGTFTQGAQVRSMGSSTTCATATTVW